MSGLTKYAYTSADKAPPVHRRIARLAFLGVSIAQIAATVELSEHTVRSVLAHVPIKAYQETLQSESIIDWIRYTDRFDALMEKSLNVVEGVLDDKRVAPTKKRWAVEFVADRDPKRRVPKRTAQEVQHSHRLEGFSTEDIERFNRRGRELLGQQPASVVEVEAAEVLPDPDDEPIRD